MSAHVMEECVVDGAMAVLLRLMRVVGMIPVRLEPRSAGFVVHYSFAQDVIARLFYVCFGLLCIALELPNNITQILLSDRPSTKIILLLSISVYVVLQVSITIISVLKGYQRTKQLCKNLSVIQKLNIEGVHDDAVANVEKRRCKLFILLLVSSQLFNVFEVILAKDNFTTSKEDYIYLIRKILQQIGIFSSVALQGEFVFSILSVHTPLQALNRRLGKMLRDFKTNNERSIESAPKKLRKLATSYITLCDVMRTLNKENGLMMLMSFAALLLRVTQSTFFLIIYWNNNPITKIPFEETDLKKLCTRMLQSCRHLFALLEIIFMLEPCQWTYNEMEVTRLFVTRLAHYASTANGPLVNELEMFYRLVFTNIPEYMPLQLITLKRGFILEVFRIG
nr:gustatory receptor 13 [Papilio dardanus]